MGCPVGPLLAVLADRILHNLDLIESMAPMGYSGTRSTALRAALVSFGPKDFPQHLDPMEDVPSVATELFPLRIGEVVPPLPPMLLFQLGFKN
jgi:hypothetical protein